MNALAALLAGSAERREVDFTVQKRATFKSQNFYFAKRARGSSVLLLPWAVCTVLYCRLVRTKQPAVEMIGTRFKYAIKSFLPISVAFPTTTSHPAPTHRHLRKNVRIRIQEDHHGAAQGAQLPRRPLAPHRRQGCVSDPLLTHTTAPCFCAAAHGWLAICQHSTADKCLSAFVSSLLLARLLLAFMTHSLRRQQVP